MQKSNLILVSALGALLCGCVGGHWFHTPTVKGSGHVVSEARPMSQFDRVSVSGSGYLSIIQGDHESLTIEADDNLLPLIKSQVSHGLLRIGPEHVNLRPTRTIRYRLQVKHLSELVLSGSLEAGAKSLTTDRLLIRISGSGRIRLPRLEANEIEVRVSGSGDIRLGGKVNHQKVEISGSGNYRAGECESQDTSVSISGSGDATIWAHAVLDAQVSGSGSVKYYGSPQVNTQVSGSGRVRSLGKK